MNSTILVLFVLIVVVLAVMVGLMVVLSYAKSTNERLMSVWHEVVSDIQDYSTHVASLLALTREYDIEPQLIERIEGLLAELQKDLDIKNTVVAANRYAVAKERVSTLMTVTATNDFVSHTPSFEQVAKSFADSESMLENSITLFNQQAEKYNHSIGSPLVAPFAALFGLQKANQFVADGQTIIESDITDDSV